MPDPQPPAGQDPATATKKPRQRIPAKPVITINPLFKALIWINSALCLVTLIGMVLLAFLAHDPMTRAQEQLASACETVFKMTAGAFIGLLGGRAAAPDKAGPSTADP